MKKLITFTAAVLFIVGFSLTASAATINPADLIAGLCGNCEGQNNLAHIDRGCEGQSPTTPFNYESFGNCDDGSYCEGAKGDEHKAYVQLCACLETWQTVLKSGDTIDVSMEVVVKKGDTLYTGDNGVYFAYNIQTIGAEIATNFDEFCDRAQCEPNDTAFAGPYLYFDSTGDELETASAQDGGPYSNPFDGNPVKLMPNFDSTTHGLVLNDPALIGSRVIYAWLDIPELRVNPAKVTRGWEVYIKVCLYHNVDTTDEAQYCDECCCLIPIGILCCEQIVDEMTLIYPYATALDDPNWWFGMTITNVGDTNGTATITLYENDGDKAEGTVTVDAHKNAILSADDLKATLTLKTTGTLGDSPSNIVVKGTEIPITGFGMMGKAATGESMGYIPVFGFFLGL